MNNNNSALLNLPDTFLERSYISNHFDIITKFFKERSHKWAEEQGIFKKSQQKNLSEAEANAIKAIKQLNGSGMNKQMSRGVMMAIRHMTDTEFDIESVMGEAFPSGNSNSLYKFEKGLFLKLIKDSAPKYSGWSSSQRKTISKGSTIFYLGGFAEKNAIFLEPIGNDSFKANIGYFDPNRKEKVNMPGENEIIDFMSVLCESETKTPIKKMYSCLASLQKETTK